MTFSDCFSVGCLILGVIFVIWGNFFVVDLSKGKKWIAMGALLLFLPLLLIIFLI